MILVRLQVGERNTKHYFLRREGTIVSNLKRRVATLLAALLVAGLGVFAIQTSASAAPVDGYVYRIKPQEDWSKCVDITGVSTYNGALAQLYDCLGPTQHNQDFVFHLVPGTSSLYQIVALHSSKCLDVVGVSTADYARVQQYSCLGYSQTNQIFDVYYYTPAAAFLITPFHSSKPLVTAGYFNGSQLYQVSNVNFYWNLFLV